MAEALFYHLTVQPLERALPALLERVVARGWRAVVRAPTPERVAELDEALWTYREESFLPHAADGAPRPERQPVWITAKPEMPNDPQALFLVDGAEAASFAAPERICVLFDGRDEAAVALARTQWKRAAAEVAATYWKQGPKGWEKAHESAPEGG